MAARQIKGVLVRLAVLLLQRRKDFLRFLVFVVMREEDRLILVTLLQLLALLLAELQDLVNRLPQDLPQLLQRKLAVLFRTPEVRLVQ